MSEGKFENIKVGDEVMLRREVLYGWNLYKYFWVPAKVTKVTTKRFACGDKEFKKDDGSRFGGKYGDYGAYLLGEKYMGWGVVEIINDQTEQMNSFKERVKVLVEIRKFEMPRVEIYNKNIEAIHQAVLNLKELIKQG